MLVESVGLTPLQAIACATVNGAIDLRMEGEVGTLAPGMAADVLVVDGDSAKNRGNDVRDWTAANVSVSATITVGKIKSVRNATVSYCKEVS